MTKQHDIKVYLSCSLTGAYTAGKFGEATRMYENILHLVDTVDTYVPRVRLWVPHLESAGLSRDDPHYAESIYALDSGAIADSDACLAILNHPSHGAGAEIQRFVDTKKPIAAIVPPTGVSLYIRGMLNHVGAGSGELARTFPVDGFGDLYNRVIGARPMVNDTTSKIIDACWHLLHVVVAQRARRAPKTAKETKE